MQWKTQPRLSASSTPEEPVLGKSITGEPVAIERPSPCGVNTIAPRETVSASAQVQSSPKDRPYGVYRCGCGQSWVELSLVCREENLSRLLCKSCKFKTYLDLAFHEALVVFMENGYRLPNGFLDKYEI